MSGCNCKKSTLTNEAKDKIREIIKNHDGMNGALIEVLHEVQDYYKYLPFDVQAFIADEMKIPLADIYGVVTFYARFSTEPVGKYRVSVCLGTACYVKGAQDIYDAIKKQLKLTDSNMTEDGMFSLDAARCVGACGLAPVVTVNEDVYGKVTPEEVDKILKKYMEEGKNE